MWDAKTRCAASEIAICRRNRSFGTHSGRKQNRLCEFLVRHLVSLLHVAASDETRRRVEHDLHDGTQQRLVSLGLAVRAAEANLPAEPDDLRAPSCQASRQDW